MNKTVYPVRMQRRSLFGALGVALLFPFITEGSPPQWKHIACSVQKGRVTEVFLNGQLSRDPQVYAIAEDVMDGVTDVHLASFWFHG